MLCHEKYCYEKYGLSVEVSVMEKWQLLVRKKYAPIHWECYGPSLFRECEEVWSENKYAANILLIESCIDEILTIAWVVWEYEYYWARDEWWIGSRPGSSGSCAISTGFCAFSTESTPKYSASKEVQENTVQICL